MKSFFKFFKNSILIIVLGFGAIATYCAINAYNKTWTIEDNHFKAIYDDYEDCKLNTMGTGTSDMCDDEKQVKYKNGGVPNEQ